MRSGSQRPRQGFTLIEIVLVLVIVALVVGGALGFMVASDDERVLSRSSVEIESLAKRARAVAALQQKPYALEFSGQSVNLMPLAEAMLDPRDRDKAAAHQEAMAAEAAATSSADSGFAPVHASWTVEEDVRLFVRRWASDDWLPVDAKNRHVWRFDPAGFCEPVGVRFAKEESWLELEFHPLTGGVRMQAQEIY
jgi:prepilin-type N-terminal cleavage/methylation domain-containing protein